MSAVDDFSRVLLLLALTLSTGYAQVTLTGKIDNYDGKSTVSYNPTIDGINSSYIYSKEAKPNRKGEFTITFNNEGIGTLRLSYNGLTYSFVHESTSKLYLRIDQSKIKFPQLENSDRPRAAHIRDSIKQAATVSIDGDLRQTNTHYNKTLRSATALFRVQGSDYSIFLSEIESTHEVMVKLDSMIQNELNQVGWAKSGVEPKSNQEHSRSAIYDYTTNQIKMYYWDVFLNGMMLKRKAQLQKLYNDPTIELSIYNQQWEQLIDTFLKDIKKNITLEPSSFESIEFVLGLEYALSQYKNYDPRPRIPGNDELVVDRFSDLYWQKLDSVIGINSKTILALRLHNLSRFLNTPTFHSPALLGSAEQLQQQNGNSSHVQEFTDEITKLRHFVKTSHVNFSKAIFIEKNYIKFEDLLLRLKGENVLIHIWATWCPPCFEDFEYNAKLKPFIDHGQLKVLYISLDKEDWANRWKEIVIFHKLEGYHVLANEILVKDMWEYLPGIDGRIPRYILVDATGKVFLNEAPRLGDDDALVKQITTLIDSQVH